MTNWNEQIFLALNAETTTAMWTTSVALWSAQWPLLITVALFHFWIWTTWRKQKRRALIAALSVIAAIVIAMLIRSFFPVDRPTAEGVGISLIPQSDSPSFPSLHATIIFSIGASMLVLAKKYVRGLGGMILALGVLAAWARTYVGVHYPLDMIGAVICALVAMIVTFFLLRLFPDVPTAISEKTERTLMSKILNVALAALVFFVGYLLTWPVPVKPVAYHPPKSTGFTGAFAVNNALGSSEIVHLPGDEMGPEDLAVMPNGTIYTTSLSGILYRIDGEKPIEVDRLGGRPLGLDTGPDGALYIADSFRGIMRWSGSGTLETVLSHFDGKPITYANQIAVASDGTIYFSNSTDRFDPETMGGTKPTSVLTIWEQSDTGYVARILPNGTTEMLADSFVYTNGIVLSPNEDFLLINETGRARVHKLWINGPNEGQREVLLDNLPGYPDNLEAQGDGTFWLAFASPRVSSEKFMPYPFLRQVIWRLGPLVRPKPIERGMLVRFDGDGRVLETLQDPEGTLGITSGGKIAGNHLYVMTLDSPWFARIPTQDLN